MHRRSLSTLLLGLTCALAWHAQPVSAQITYTFLQYGDRDVPASGATNYLVNWPISYDECVANAPIRMTITGAPYDGTGVNRLEWDLWQGGTGTTGANCQTATNRRTMSGSAPLCAQRTPWTGGGQITTTMPTIQIRPQELFPDGCDATAQGTYVFYVLAVSAPGDTTTDVAAARYFSFSVALDFEPPSAPTLSDAAGDRAISVGWSNTTSETLSGARVYVDLDGDCDGATILSAGSAAPSSLAPATEISGSAPTSATLDGEALGLDLGDAVPMAVTVFDRARNESVLSNVACLSRVPVSGFWDEYCAQEGAGDADACRERYSGCTLQPSRTSSAPWFAWSLFAVGLLALARRRLGDLR